MNNHIIAKAMRYMETIMNGIQFLILTSGVSLAISNDETLWALCFGWGLVGFLLDLIKQLSWNNFD